MPNWSRRHFLGAALATAAVAPANGAARFGAAQAPARGARLKVQFTPGGHTSPLQMYAMFTDPMFQDVDTTVLPHPRAFDGVGGPNAPDVIVTNDWITGGWPESDRAKMVKHLDAGKGVVVLHHAVGTNNDQWAWWSEEVIGCYLYNPNVPGMKTEGRLKQF